MLRSILAVVIPVVVWGGLWAMGGAVFQSLFPNAYDAAGVPTDSAILGLVILFSAVLSILAGWLCVKMSRSPGLKIVLVLGIVQLLIGIGVQASVWNSMPLWYHIIFLGLVVPMHILGGQLGLKSLPRFEARNAANLR